MVNCVGPDGTGRSVPLGILSYGSNEWNNGSFEVPPLNVIAEGSHSITLGVTGSGGAQYLLDYQLLVYLETTG